MDAVIHIAVRQNDGKIVKALLESKAYNTMTNWDGHDAIRLAEVLGHWDALKAIEDFLPTPCWD